LENNKYFLKWYSIRDLMSETMKLAATGDSIINMKVSMHEEEDFLYLFDLIGEADVRFTNFEVICCEFDKGYPQAEYGIPYQIAEPHLVDEFKWAGFNIVSRANNHTLDWGYEGMFSSSSLLDDRGIVHSGVGKNLSEARSPGYLETDKGRVSLISTASSFPNFSRAGGARRDVQGRPGLSPLRYRRELQVTKEDLEELKKILKKINANMAIGPIEEDSITYGRGLNAVKFTVSDTPGLYTEPYEQDLEEVKRSIKDAERMSDLVLVAHHGHEDDGSDRFKPAKFLETYARACIDAGADAFLGHGPHLLRGIEIYKGKPILYSMGNFFFQFDVSKFQGQEYYDRYDLGNEATPADAYDAAREQAKEKDWRGWNGFAFEPSFWDSIIAQMEFEGRELQELKIHPATLGFNKQRTERGRPMKASQEDSERILKHIQKYSEPYGTRIKIEENIGIIEVK
jgi:poly-gamma-glutamate synthesis protein (capsule biosynthesis protein)